MNPKDLKLYLVTKSFDDEERFLKTVEDALKGGVTICQLREKEGESGDIYNLALKLKKITDKYDVPLIIDDRVDIMLACDCAGIHIGQSDLPCDVVREIIGKDKIIGVSAHNVEEAKKAQKDGADYLGCGAVYPTQTKKNANNLTKEELTNISKAVDIPIVAIGGIKAHNAHELANTGIDGICVVTEIMDNDNPKLISERLLEISKNII